MIDLAANPALRGFIRTWAVILAVSCAGMIAVVLGVLWVMSGFHGLGIGATLAIALIAGALGATALEVLLMALVFYSDTARIDDAIAQETTSNDRASTEQDNTRGR